MLEILARDMIKLNYVGGYKSYLNELIL